MNYFKTLSFTSDFGSDRDRCKNLFVFSCGYERRSIYLLANVIDRFDRQNWDFCGFSFREFQDEGSRLANDQFLKRESIESIPIDYGDFATLIQQIELRCDSIKEAGFVPRLIVDYSSMPRGWYCNLLAALVGDFLPGVESEFWYVIGKFGGEEYPCVGYGEFEVYSGTPKVTDVSHSHIFGLGFDSIRTYGIWNYLDPLNVTCLIGVTPDNSTEAQRVYEENQEIIRGAADVMEMPMGDFASMYSILTDKCLKLTASGQVALVPDGPKPLVMAMSLIPITIQKDGVYSWHVGHVKPKNYAPIDVEGSDRVYGFRIINPPQAEIAYDSPL